jgi:integrase
MQCNRTVGAPPAAHVQSEVPRYSRRQPAKQVKSPSIRTDVEGVWMTRHKGTGMAYVSLPDANGRQVRRYCGTYYGPDGKPSREAVRRAEEAIRASRTLGGATSPAGGILTVTELATRYRVWFNANKKPSEQAHTKLALEFLSKHFGAMPADKFRGQLLLGFRDKAAQSGRWNDRSIMDYSRRVVGAFAWGNVRDLIDDGQLKNLEKAQGEPLASLSVRSPRVVRPVPLEQLNKVIPHLPGPVAGIVRFMARTGCRCAEAVQLRECDLDKSDPDCWVFTPLTHKNAHREGQELLTIFVNVDAQEALRPFLAGRHLTSNIFDPRDAVRELLARQKAEGRVATPEGRERALALVGAQYTTGSVRQALLRAARRAGVAPFGPHRIRHLSSTAIREEHGFEGSQAMLQQKDPAVVARYAEKSRKLAIETAKNFRLEVG